MAATTLRQAQRDPFAVDIVRALEALGVEWGFTHRLWWARGRFQAQRVSGGGRPVGPRLAGRTPDELVTELRHAWGEA